MEVGSSVGIGDDMEVGTAIWLDAEQPEIRMGMIRKKDQIYLFIGNSFE
jgi:hypothetical protein